MQKHKIKVALHLALSELTNKLEGLSTVCHEDHLGLADLIRGLHGEAKRIANAVDAMEPEDFDREVTWAEYESDITTALNRVLSKRPS